MKPDQLTLKSARASVEKIRESMSDLEKHEWIDFDDFLVSEGMACLRTGVSVMSRTIEKAEQDRPCP